MSIKPQPPDIEIDFGPKRERAMQMWFRLDALMHSIEKALHSANKIEALNILSHWQITGGNKIDTLHWLMRLSPPEWKALSLGLRQLGRKGDNQVGKTARSMYGWLRRHRVEL